MDDMPMPSITTLRFVRVGHVAHATPIPYRPLTRGHIANGDAGEAPRGSGESHVLYVVG